MLLLAFAWFAAITASLMAGVQFLMSLSYAAKLRAHRALWLPDAECKPAAVILTLRGGDESMTYCLDGLMEQDYPDYRISIVIDHPTDPAAAVVEAWRRRHPAARITIDYLRNPSPDAHLKSNSLGQAVAALPEEVEWVALIDADVRPHRSWLRQLTAPLTNPEVGVVTGNRWYYPLKNQIGAWVRFTYNACCMAPMKAMDATWGGSLSMKREVFDREMFRRRIRRTSVEDLAITTANRDAGLKLAFAPSILMWNPEGSSFRGCYEFIKRQLVWTRLYLPIWPLLLGHSIFTCLLLTASFFVGVAVVASDPRSATLLFLGPALYTISSLASIGLLHAAVRGRVNADQLRDMSPLSLGDWLWIVGTSVTTLFTYTAAVIAAQRTRVIGWRGITYDVVPPDGIRMRAYSPLSSPHELTYPTGESTSPSEVAEPAIASTERSR